MADKLLALDLDGTVRQTISGQTFINHPHDQKIIEGASKAIAHAYSQSFAIVGITNQGGCSSINRETGKPYKTVEDCIEEQRQTLRLVPEMMAIFFCPDRGETCYRVQRDPVLDVSKFGGKPLGEELGSYRKPGAGMLNLACQILGIPRDLRSSAVWYVGDREEDREAASVAGVQFLAADIWRDRTSTAFGFIR